MLRQINLHGSLGEKFGETWELDVDTPFEVFQALQANYRDLSDYLDDLAANGFNVRIERGGKPVTLHEIGMLGEGNIDIYPMIAGSGDGKTIATFLISAALIGASFFVPAAGFTFLGKTITQGSLRLLGTVLGLSGVANLLIKPPDILGPDEAELDKTNTVFSGPVNTTKLGVPVPVGYGELVIGSHVISAEIVVNEDPPPQPPGSPYGEQFTNPAIESPSRYNIP